MEIAFACNQTYFDGLIATVLSILVSNQREDREINFHVLDGGIDQDSWDMMAEKSKHHKTRSTFRKYQVNTDEFKNFPALHGNHVSYYRFFLEDIITGDKILFMDCDMLCRKNLFEFWDNFDFSSEGVVAGCIDPIIKYLHNDSHLLSTGREAEPYINAGFLLINLKRWRDLGIKQECMQLLNDKGHLCRYHDQTALNYVLKGKIDFLDASFNTLTYPPLKDELGDVVIHYVTKYKPWIAYSHNPSYREWREFYKTHVRRTPTYAYNATYLLSFAKEKLKVLLTDVTHGFFTISRKRLY